MVRTTVTLLFLAWLVDYVDRLVITLALPAIGHDFALDKAGQGLVLTVFFITYALAQLPGGLIADRIGSRRTLTLALGLWTGFTALTAAAFSYPALLAIRALFGLGEGLFPAASMKAITERTEPAQRMTANALMLCSNQFGSAVAPLLAAPLIAALGWRISFVGAAALGLAMTLAIAFLLPRATRSATSRAAPGATRRVLSTPAIWLCAAMFCGLDVIAWGLTAWTPGYLIEARHIDVRSAGVLTSIPFFAAGFATVLGGWLFDRRFHARMRWLVVPAMLGAGVFLVLMIRAHGVDDFILWESCALACTDLCFVPMFGLPLRLLPPDLAGAGAGLVNFGGQFAGAVTPFVMGALADAAGFGAAFTFLLAGVALSVVAALLCPQTTEDFSSALARHGAV